MSDAGTVEVRSRIFQATAPDAVLPTVTLPILNEEITVAELIRRTVTEQIHELLATRKLDVNQAHQALQRQYLTDAEIHRQAGAGKIALPTSEAPQDKQIKPENEVQRALNAFEQRAYVIIVDGKIANQLDEKLLFQPGCSITFFRLIPLIGG